MNVFVLCTGRCGSTTFIQACQHITNFTSAHESRSGRLGDDRFDYPENHIEADNRLSWFLGKLDSHYGNDAFYVHLKRNDNDTAKSLAKRYSQGIMKAYRRDMLLNLPAYVLPSSVSLDYCNTVNSNIELFLKDKTQKMKFHLENSKEDFQKFYKLIGAEGNLTAALSEFDIAYNSSSSKGIKRINSLLLLQKLQKLSKLITGEISQFY